MRKFFSWFNTSPKIKSDKVLAIEVLGYSHWLIEAVDKYKKGEISTKIYVKKV